MIATATHRQRLLILPPGTEELYNTWHFSQALRISGILCIASQVGIGADGQPGITLEEQTRFAFQNLLRVLEAAGAAMSDIVELITYHIDMDDLPKVSAVKAEFIMQELPAWTTVEVTQLALPWMLIKVKATAVCDG